MKKILIILFSLLSFALTAQDIGGDYYVSTTGNDSNPGTYSQPWATWQKAFNTADAGDTVYFRGGVWYPSTTMAPPNQSTITLIDPLEGFGNNGTYNNPITFINYPGEVPVMDCVNVTATGEEDANSWLSAITLVDAHHIIFKGLTIKNVLQKRNYVEVTAIGSTLCT